jgi:demethylmenaquinone methyltransferase/2-methoxy-6-polyprenyl-1,4-benzoquinol methylase
VYERAARGVSGRVYEWAAPVYNLASRALVPENRLRARAISALGDCAGEAVLDIGCGTGFHFPELRAAVGERGRVVGLDTSPASIDVARRRAAALGLSFEGIVAHAAELPAAARSFRAAIAVFSMSVIPRWEQACERAVRALSPGGRLVILEQRLAEKGWARLFNPVATFANTLLGATPERDYAAALSSMGVDVTEERFLGGLYAITIARAYTGERADRGQGGEPGLTR